MFWSGGQIRRCFGLVGRSGDVLGWWTYQEMFWTGSWVERCFGLMVGLRDILD